MRKGIYALTGLLMLQLVILLLVYRPASILPDAPTGEPLAPFPTDRIDEIHIGDSKDQEAQLQMQDGVWSLPDFEGLPADASKIQSLIDAISSDDIGWPVAETVAARQRFQVAAYYFRRRITFIGDGELLGTIYLGTSPGFRKVHARNDAQDAIYNLEFNAFDAPAVSEGWLDRKLLQIADPQAIEGAGFSLVKEQGIWRNAAGGQPEQRELDALLLALRSLQVEAVADEDDQRTLSEMTPALSLRITDAAGTCDLELYELDGGHAAYSSRHALFFALSAYDFDRLAGIDGRLLAAVAPDE